jgi:hypothetical protein
VVFIIDDATGKIKRLTQALTVRPLPVFPEMELLTA